MSASPISQVFVVDNLSTVVNDGDARTMIRACNVFMPEVATAWGVPAPTILFAKDTRPVPGAWLFHIIDSDPSEPGLLAYHEDTGNVPDGFILARTILQNGGAVLYAGPAPTVASALFHEIAETLIDPDCNSWWQGPNGTRFAAEIVDPVQGQIVPIALSSSDSASPAPPTCAPVIVPAVPATPQPPPKPVPPRVVTPPAPSVQPPAPPSAAAPFNLFAPWWQPPGVTEAPTPTPTAPASSTTARWSPWAAPQRALRASIAFRPSDPQSCTLGIGRAPAANSVPESKCVVGLADFVYPAWSNANAIPGSRFSYTGIVKSPFSIAKGGYAVTTNARVNGGQPTNVYGEEMPNWIRRAKERAGRPIQRKIIHEVEGLVVQTKRSNTR